MSTTILARNFHGLKDVRLTVLPGVSAVVGTNGAGKTTLGFIGDILRRATSTGMGGLSAAIEHYGGGRTLRHFAAPPDEPVLLGIEADEARWEIEPLPQGSGIAGNPAERLLIGDRVIFDRQAGRAEVAWDGKEVTLSDSRTVIRRLLDSTLDGKLPGARLLDILAGYKLYYDLDLRSIRRGSPDSSHRYLFPDGSNVFSVLRNWRDLREDRHRFEFVMDSLGECFGYFDDLELVKGGNVIEGHLYRRGFNTPIPASAEASGLLAALAHFAAVASASRGHVVFIDEFENSLHPRAVSTGLDLVRAFAEQHEIAVTLATQSTDVLNWFDGHSPSES
ncbi:MAG: AAA family ATPase [Polyangiaceae bacterium]